MPVSDASSYLFDAAASDAAGPVVLAGAVPVDGMLLRVMAPTGTTGNYTIEQSDVEAFTTSANIEVGATGAFVAGETVLQEALTVIRRHDDERVVVEIETTELSQQGAQAIVVACDLSGVEIANLVEGRVSFALMIRNQQTKCQVQW